jgi:hypothetical protein
MFIAMLFTTAKLWSQPRCPTTDEWTKKMWYIYTMEYYSAFAGKWLELEIIISKISQTRKDKYHISSLI